MNREIPDNRFLRQPLCKFGPGGDFTTKWNLPVPPRGQQTENTLGKVLSALAEIIGATINPETLAELQSQVDTEMQSYKIPSKEIISVEPKKNKHTNNPASAKGTQRHCLVRGQTMLFSDDSRNSARAKRKPHNSIRAYRRPARKKTAYEIKGQGTLFDNYAKGTTAA